MACRTSLAHQPRFDKLGAELSAGLMDDRSLVLSLPKDGPRVPTMRDRFNTKFAGRGTSPHPGRTGDWTFSGALR